MPSASPAKCRPSITPVVLPRGPSASQAAPERPIGWRDPDPLRFKPLAISLSRFLRNENTEPPLTVAIMTGQSVSDVSQKAVANLGWKEIRLLKPVFHGDTIHGESEVLEARESRSRPDNGIVVFVHRGYNQRDELVMSCKRTALMMKRPAAVV